MRTRLKRPTKEHYTLIELSLKFGARLLLTTAFAISGCGQRSENPAEWQKRVDENYMALRSLQQKIASEARRVIEDPERNFMLEVGRKLKEHKGPGPALTPEEQQKLAALVQRQKEDTARAKALQDRATELALDTAAISLSISEKCHFSGRFGEVAEAVKNESIVRKHAQRFWRLKWNYDESLPSMGFVQAACRTVLARWENSSDLFRKLFRDSRSNDTTDQTDS
jgi:hypothetical protein